MRRSCFACFCVFFLHHINSVPDDDCFLEGVEDIHWLTAYKNDPIDDFEEKEFKRFLFENISGVTVRGDDYGKYFEAKLEDNFLIIFPTDNFKSFEVSENSTENPEMNIVLNLECKTGTRPLSFYQPIRDHNTYLPEFGQASYTYTLPMPLPGKFDLSVFGEEIIACDLDISNVRLDFTVDPPNDFALFWNGPIDDTNKCHKAILKTIKPMRLTSEKGFEIIVIDSGIPPRTTITRLEIHIDESISIPQNPQFESAYYTANSSFENGTYNISVDKPIRLINGCSNVELQLLEYKDNFEIHCTSNEIEVKVVSSPSEDLLDHMVVVLLTIVATLEHAETRGETVLAIYLPKPKCPEMAITACPYTIDPQTECPMCSSPENICACIIECSIKLAQCPSCSSSLPVELKAVSSTELSAHLNNLEPTAVAVIKFKKNNYSFKVESSQQRFVGTVAAGVIPEEVIEYFLETGETFMRINKSTGALDVLTQLKTKTYSLTVYAEAVHSKITTNTSVTVTVLQNTETIFSVLTKHVVENERRIFTFPCPCDLCTYTIIDQYPETNPKLFGVYNQNLVHAVPIDREMDEIINMKVPQFMLRLRLTSAGNCSKETFNNTFSNINTLYDNAIFKEWIFTPARVSNAPDQILATIIVDDTNDNPPVFKAGVKLVIGYPVQTLARVIAPLYLAKVTATDLDVGDNAQIRYGIDDSHFIIHPITGVIYAGNDAVDDDSHSLSFNVRATDRNGAEDGLSADLIVEVKPLKQSHLIVVTTQIMMLEELDTFLEKLSSRTNMKIKYLCRAPISVTYTEQWSGSLARIIVYALNHEDELIEAHVLENELEVSMSSEEFKIEKLNSTSLFPNENSNKHINRAGLIAAVAILSILLVCFVNAFVAFCYFKIWLHNNKSEAKVTNTSDK